MQQTHIKAFICVRKKVWEHRKPEKDYLDQRIAWWAPVHCTKYTPLSKQQWVLNAKAVKTKESNLSNKEKVLGSAKIVIVINVIIDCKPAFVLNMQKYA